MIIIDNSYKKLDDKLRGRKPKVKLEKDGIKYIFKWGAINYEIWSELISEQIGKQLGIDMAHYELATCCGTYGVLTPSFLKDDEIIISSDNLKASASLILGENGLVNNSLQENTFANLIKSIQLFKSQNKDFMDIDDKIINRCFFYMLIMESDKNATNISFIKGKDGIRLAPDYDNASMVRLNENINDFIEDMKKCGRDVRDYTDNIKGSFYLADGCEGVFINDFTIFCNQFPKYTKRNLELFSELDLDKAFDEVERINEVEIPWEVKFWVRKVINTRIDDMNSIYKELHSKNATKK